MTLRLFGSPSRLLRDLDNLPAVDIADGADDIVAFGFSRQSIGHRDGCLSGQPEVVQAGSLLIVVGIPAMAEVEEKSRHAPPPQPGSPIEVTQDLRAALSADIYPRGEVVSTIGGEPMFFYKRLCRNEDFSLIAQPAMVYFTVIKSPP